MNNWTYRFLLLAFFGAINFTIAQPKHDKAFKDILQEADEYFEAYDFRNAELKYMSIWKQDSTNDLLNFNLAVCKYKLKELPDSVLYFLKRADKSTKPEVQYYEGKLFHLTHRFTDAVEHYKLYLKYPEAKREVKDLEVERLIGVSNRAYQMMAEPHKASIKNIGNKINTSYDEYVPLVSTDETIMYFTSRRPGGVSDIKDAYGKYYEDVYMSEVKKGEWQAPKNVGAPVNSNTHDACVAVSADLQQMIVYRTSPDGKTGDLYHVEQTEKGWSQPTIFGPEINSDSREFSATFNIDNTVIYFSSDRPGGFGGMDLYRTVRLPNGKWSLPWNLGPTINTAQDEDAPFLHVDGKTLYFSSKGHETMGEYDIFKSEILENNQFTTPVNLGYPINTVGDDIFFVLSPDGRHGYYSSLNENSSESGYESEDIYYIDMRYSDADLLVRKGVIFEANADIPVSAKVTLLNTETNKVEGVYNSASNSGKFVFVVNPFYSYKIMVDAKGYETTITELHPLIEDNVDEENIPELVLKLKHQ